MEEDERKRKLDIVQVKIAKLFIDIDACERSKSVGVQERVYRWRGQLAELEIEEAYLLKLGREMSIWR